ANATVLATGFVIVNVRALVALGAMDAGLKLFAIDGGATTTRVAEAVPPVPPCVEVTAAVVLVCAPAPVPVTFAENVQVELEVSDAPVKLTALLPAAAVIVPPPHDPVRPFGVAITKPDGRVSVNPTPESVCVVLLFCNEKDSEVDPFRGMLV